MHIEDLLAKQFDLKKPLTNNRCLSLYSVSECYGGPEEGGWWYNNYHLKAYRICRTEEEATKTRKEMQKCVDEQEKIYKRERHRYYETLPDPDETPCPVGGAEGYIPTGWSDGEQYVIIVEDNPGDHETKGRPHYE